MSKHFDAEQPTAHARTILTSCDIPIGADFHTLSSAQVSSLIEWADTCRYSKPRNANGSRARYFHARLQRRAQGVTLSDVRQWQAIAHAKTTCVYGWSDVGSPGKPYPLVGK